MTLTSTCKKTLEGVVSNILPGRQDKVILKPPTHPLFEGLQCRRLRVLLAVVMDSDAMPGGLPGLNVTKLSAHMKSIRATGVE